MSTALRNLQETLDENKENVPEGLYLQLMTGLNAVYNEDDADRMFHSVTYVLVSPHSSRRVTASLHCAICEEVSRGPPNTPESWMEAIRSSSISVDMIEYTVFPLLVRDNRGNLYIFTNVTALE